MIEIPELSQRLTELVQTVPGVEAVYSASPVIGTMLGAVKDLVKQTGGGTALANVTVNETGTSVAVTIGVNGSESAPDVCRRVFDTIAAYLRTPDGDRDATITVRVARVG